jgi:hypothetical protein
MDLKHSKLPRHRLPMNRDEFTRIIGSSSMIGAPAVPALRHLTTLPAMQAQWWLKKLRSTAEPLGAEQR